MKVSIIDAFRKEKYMTYTLPAYAKINLFLDISKRRENGYHDVLSLMQSVSLCDDITVTFCESDEKNISVYCSDPSIPCGSDNLVYKAADVFLTKGNIEIRIEKRIPASAGLAGGSTDAAATLVALNKLTGERLTEEELCAIGAKLGADIPFCIKGGACLAEGIGEVLTTTAGMPSYPIVIAKKGEGMSTPAAYRALDEKFSNFIGYNVKKELLEKLQSSASSAEDYCKGLFNIFESVVEPIRPAVNEAKQIMMSSGAAGAMMSGSGTSVFGIFEKEEDAMTAKKLLEEVGASAHVCYPI